MQQENAFSTEGMWLRGNTHTHTNRSDGDADPEVRIQQYIDGGYDFLALTDHLRTYPVEEYQTHEIELIGALEFHPEHPTSNSGGWHLIALDVPHEKEPISTDTSAQKLVNHFKNLGGYIVLCHPYWCGFSKEELELIKGADALEVYNHVTELLVGKGDSTNEYDSMLQWGHNLAAIACDDAHSGNHCFGGWINVKAKERSSKAIMDAIRQGHFYASCGPEFKDIRWDGKTLIVECSPVKSIKFISRGPMGNSIRADEAELVYGEYEMKRDDLPYLRVQIEDEKGNRAWSNPIFYN